MNIQFLIKFGEPSHLEQLLKFGHIYIKPGTYFKQNIDHHRFDKAEGRIRVEHIKNNYLHLKAKDETQWKKLFITTGQFEYWFDLSEYFIYSFFSISSSEAQDNEYFEFPKGMQQMGDFYLVIRNPREFMNRLLKVLNEKGFTYNYNLVEYYDDSVNQKKLTLFHKSKNYDFQKEFRILINDKFKGPLEFDIGNLEDIAEICSFREFTGLKFAWQ